MAPTCEEIRDRFSALREDELSPSGQAEVKGHLEFCSDCQKEFARFDKTLSMLHAVEEVEAPERFLSGIYEKIEKRRRKHPSSAWSLWRWPPLPNRLKLPIQALAMVVIVFLALYLTKMIPGDFATMKGPGEPRSSLSEGKREPVDTKTPALEEKIRDQVSVPKQADKERDGNVSGSLKEEEPRKEVAPSSAPRLKGAEAPQPAAPLSVSHWPEPSEEFVLKITDEKNALSHLRELVMQFGGETLNVERNRLLVSLPNASLAEFRKGLEDIGSFTKAQQQETSLKAPEAAVAASPGKGGEHEKKNEETKSPEPSREIRTLIRIVLEAE